MAERDTAQQAESDREDRRDQGSRPGRLRLVSFFLHRSPGQFILASLAGVLSGLCTSGLLSLINQALNREDWSTPPPFIYLFVGLFLLLPASRVVSQFLLARITQAAIKEMQVDLSQNILASPLSRLQQLGSHRLLAALIDDINTVSRAVTLVPAIAINSALMLGCFVYLGQLSPKLLLALLGVMAVLVASYQLPMQWGYRRLSRARKERDELFGHFRSLTEGSKELKLHNRRRRDFLAVLRATAERLRALNLSVLVTFSVAGSWGQLVFFLLVGMLVLVLPGFTGFDRETVTGYTLVLVFMMTPLQGLLNMVPELERVNVALEKIEELGFSLDPVEPEEIVTPVPNPVWSGLALEGVSYVHRGGNQKELFQLGPIDLTLNPGELVFLTGGNGSGKTTLAMVIAGLYSPESGIIRFNGEPVVTPEEFEAHRQNFSAVFSDFYLFEQFLGLEQPDLEAEARGYIERLQLQGKVEIVDGGFSTLSLSQGQRKRLALLTAYLERRPIYVFDEWAAEQDPVFREIFYRQMLPELRSQGKAVLVISHDDRYYDVADRIIKLDYGLVVSDGQKHEDDEVPRPLGRGSIARGTGAGDRS